MNNIVGCRPEQISSNSDNETNAGLFNLNSNNTLGNSNANVSRLKYYHNLSDIYLKKFQRNLTSR